MEGLRILSPRRNGKSENTMLPKKKLGKRCTRECIPQLRNDKVEAEARTEVHSRVLDLVSQGVISDALSETRRLDAKFFIPTENEWYKAAYHQPSADGGDIDDYWLYPTASDSVPTIATANATGDIGNPGPNVANYDFGADWNGQDGNVTTVGSAGPLGESFYGTSDQGGNLLEWNEAVFSGSLRGVRGGSWFEGETPLEVAVSVRADSSASRSSQPG